MILDFIKHCFASKNEYGLHSPFLYEFYNAVIKHSKNQPQFSEIQKLKERLIKDHSTIKIEDYGAGSKFGSNNQKKVSAIVKYAHRSAKWAQIFTGIISKYQYQHVIELGTSLGLTTAYLAKANPKATIYTLEGCPNTLQIAKSGFKEVNIQNAIPILGNIDDTLPVLVKQLDRIDFVLFDANHRYEPTIRYFEQCLLKSHEDSCFVFDDIYWSPGMKKAWLEICQHPKVSLSLDFYHLGIVFFRQKQHKQHFVLKA